MLEQVRGPLLEEARRSPSLLSDLAGLEQYVAESYDARSFAELLQNADDAGASRFQIQKTGPFLIVANDGRRFSRSDFESLCRSAASSKRRGMSIGYRGIGFKSVVNLARSIHVVSGELEATFSRERTAEEVPHATRVPLVRIPHPLDGADRARFSADLDHLISDGFATAFVFDHLLASNIEKEFATFDPSSLLFLRNVRRVALHTDTEAVITVDRESIDDRARAVRLDTDNSSSRWLLFEQNEIALAFGREGERILRLNEHEAVVHAFLPTLETTGLGIKIHGDISTDPSRTRVVFDERTASDLTAIAALIVTLLDEGLSGRTPSDAAGMVAALTPFADPRMAGFQRRSFRTDLVAAIRSSAGERFASLRYRPIWLNAVDFETLSGPAGIRTVPRALDGIEGLQGFLRFLGAKEATFEELSCSLPAASVSVPGAAELVAHLTQRHTTKQIDAASVNPEWRLWPVDGTVLSFVRARAAGSPLDRDFADLVAEKAGVGAETCRLIADMSDKPTAVTLLPDSPALGNESLARLDPQHVTYVQPLSLKRWRSAEQQILSLLTSLGWTVEDVSRQNVGYDIEGRAPDGQEAFIEVKSIDCVGQAFTLTSNEEAVARQKGTRYQLAIVRQTENVLEVAFIRDPVQHLRLTRQCRQWVWECAGYSFEPQRFPVE